MTAPSVSPARTDGDQLGDGVRSLGDFARRFVKNLGYLTVVTVPLIAAGVLLSSLVLPFGLAHAHAGALTSILVVAAIARLRASATFPSRNRAIAR